ncbi:AbrB family transcriptional regulator [Rhodobacterales bacterium HKCCE3408]|nr:AbrB family transcriptional regulator [Rhodobacterales bacterium HKCCE3408]
MTGQGRQATDWRAVGALAVTAAAGAVLAVLAGVPAPFLTGPAACVSVAAIAGLKVLVPNRLRDLCFLLIGVGMGTGLTPEALNAAARWPVPLVALALAMVVLLVTGAALLNRGFGFPPKSALLAATPGHLSFVLAMAESVGSDVPRVAVLQALRVLYLTLLVPVAVRLWTGEDLSTLPAPTSVMAPLPLLLICCAAAGLGTLFLRWRLPAAMLLGGMSVSALSHATGLVAGAMPQAVAIPAFVLMGGLIGTRFVGVSLGLLRSAAIASAALTTLAIAITIFAAQVVHLLVGLPLLDLLIAFAPGGLETMAALALMLGADPAFVALHHLARLVFLSFLVPLAIARR